MYRSYVTTRGFKAGVYRQAEDNSMDFVLVGETTIDPTVLGVNTLYMIPNADDWIDFRPGDMIGWRVHISEARLSYSDDATSKLLYSNAVGYNDKGVGDTFTMVGLHQRRYSIQAVQGKG